ncbi:MAG: hypothetical protein QM804_03350 [Propionicimonas sp.]
MGDDGPLLPVNWEWLALAGGLPLAVIIAAVVTAIVLYRIRQRDVPAELPREERPALGGPSLETQLIEVDDLLAQGRITPDEHAILRSRILGLQ